MPASIAETSLLSLCSRAGPGQYAYFVSSLPMGRGQAWHRQHLPSWVATEEALDSLGPLQLVIAENSRAGSGLVPSGSVLDLLSNTAGQVLGPRPRGSDLSSLSPC